jgi:hypothetical protein
VVWMPIFHSDIIKLLDRFDLERKRREKTISECLKQGKDFPRERIPDLDELKTLILSLYLTRMPLKRLLDLSSMNVFVDRGFLVFLFNNKKRMIPLEDPFALEAWDYLKTILPETFVFYDLRKKKNIRAILRQWFLTFNHKVRLKDFY